MKIGGYKFMSIYTDLIDNLEELKLDKIKNMLPGYLDEMKDKNISFTEMMYDLTKEEIKYFQSQICDWRYFMNYD